VYTDNSIERVFCNTRSIEDQDVSRRYATASPHRRVAISARSWQRETKSLRHINRIHFLFAERGGRETGRFRNEWRRDTFNW